MDETHRIHTPLSLNGGLDAYHAIENAFDPSGPGAYLKLLTDLRLAVGLAKIDAAVDWVDDLPRGEPRQESWSCGPGTSRSSRRSPRPHQGGPSPEPTSRTTP